MAPTTPDDLPNPSEASEAVGELTRRELLGLAGAAGLVVGVGGSAAALPPPPLPILVRTLTLRRRDDFVNLRFELHNIRVSADGRTLHPILPPPIQSRLIVVFPPQSVAEVTSLDDGPLPARPVAARLSRESRLAFDVTDDLPFELTLEQLLSWNRRVPLLVPNALSNANRCYVPNLRQPEDYETSLELPWKLQLSPHHAGGWAHRTGPVTGPTGWTELWHTRLGVRAVDAPHGVDEHDDTNRIVRAVWARYPQFAQWLDNPTLVPDKGEAGPQDPDDLAMDARSRYEIVRLSSDSSLDSRTACPQPIIGPRRHPNRREPVQVNLLMLTSLGGWLDSTSYWRRLDNSQGAFSTDLESWQHRATLGRDHYVRLVRRGFLFPFGHRAVYLELSERKLLGSGPQRAAYLRKRFFIVVRQPVKTYAGDDATPNDGRGMPFTSVRVLTRVTPNLRPPQDSTLAPVSVNDAFVPTMAVGGSLFQFLFRGTDHAGRTVDFRAPVVFAADRFPVPSPDPLPKIIAAYADADTVVDHPGLRTGEFGRKHTAVAPYGDDPAETTVVVDTVQFLGEPAAGSTPEGEARFYPKVAEFSVDLPEARALAGDSAKLARLSYPQVYLLNGPDGTNNPGEAFLEAEAGKETALGFATDRAGGVATPNIHIRGLSRKFGPVTEKGARAAKQEFDPGSMFANAATLLGGVSLGQVLVPATAGVANPGQAVELVTRELGDAAVETRLRWQPALRSFAVFKKAADTTLELRARVVAERDQPPYYEINGKLTSFTLSFFPGGGFIDVRVSTLRFTSASDQKPDVDCDIAGVDFHEALSFVRELAEVCNFGDGGGLSIVPSSDRITIGLDVPLPSLTVGILGLENIKVAVGLVIPFDSTPVLMRFAFCSREDPFILSVMFFRGSGFVAIEAGAHGLDMVEFSFEFGVGMSIDLGVASGSVEIMGGLYYQLANNGGGDDDQTIAFSMYLRLRGELDVLGLISASLEFYLSLDYKSPDRMYGSATLTVSIDLLIFSGEVEVTCRREFKRGSGMMALNPSKLLNPAGPGAAGAGDGGEPIRFGDAMPQNVWNTYCAAFAAV